MARDRGLEELLNDDLRAEAGITGKAMFGGWVWLVHGNLLCGARDDGMLVRLGKDKDAWALKMPGVVPMMSGRRRMPGWVWVAPEIYGNDAHRAKLLDAALTFVWTLAPK